ncbi:Sec-independent protein translocase subunit TatA/TatB [Kordia sp.]|uniref:Sec-independent protein translocase subunit TatA/TatB n=1 Tax=Kordia sp. TaxID=1965332 RepID=UPI003D6B4F7F
MTLFISGGEIFVIMLIVVMVFGADKIPEIARGLGKGMRQLKDATNEIKHEIQQSAEDNAIDAEGIAGDVQNEINKVKEDIEDMSGPIKRQF